jgi:hypothetical protein
MKKLEHYFGEKGRLTKLSISAQGLVICATLVFLLVFSLSKL